MTHANPSPGVEHAADWLASGVALDAGGLRLQFAPGAPRPAGPALQRLVLDAAWPLVRTELKDFGSQADAEALRFAAGAVLPVLRATRSRRLREVLGRLSRRVGPLLSEAVDSMRALAWLTSANAANRLAEALAPQVEV
jgi:hypothetical protein